MCCVGALPQEATQDASWHGGSHRIWAESQSALRARVSMALFAYVIAVFGCACLADMAGSPEQGSAQCSFIVASASLSSGKPWSIHLKVRHHDEGIYWELRWLLISMGMSSKKGVCGIYRREKELWEADLQSFDVVPVRSHLVWSRRMSDYRNTNTTDLMHDEMSCSSRCCLLVLLRASESRRKAHDKQVGRAVLETLLSQVLGEKCVQLAKLGVSDGEADLCVVNRRVCERSGSMQQAQCSHLRHVATVMEAFCDCSGGRASHAYLTRLLIEVFAGSTDCAGVLAWAKRLVATGRP